MKMVRSLLLGAAAGFVAIAGAQAADLPVKAKPVQYVKICDLYGAGFYYIPGTDTCIKLGGYIRTGVTFDSRAGVPYANGAPLAGQQAWFNRSSTQDVAFRSRLIFTGDTRSQTSMGTLRSYFMLQADDSMPATGAAGENAVTMALTRAFIQFAGFTIGRTLSIADTPELQYPFASYSATVLGGYSGPTGINALQYVAQFGNGVSGAIAIESADIRSHNIVNLGGGAAPAAAAFGYFVNAVPGVSSAQTTYSRNTPDVVANLTVTQAWGSAVVAAALHNDNASYYSGTGGVAGVGGTAGSAACGLGLACGHPADAWGYALLAGIAITTIPGLPGDAVSLNGGYSVGASGYTTFPFSGQSIMKGTTLSLMSTVDGVYSNGSNVELLTAWFVQAAYQHRWNPTLTSSIYGGYSATSFGGNATAMICPGGPLTAAPTGTGLTGVANCNPNSDWWTIGSRVFNWTPVPNLDIGLDIGWQHYDSAFAGAGVFPATAIAGGTTIPAQAITLGGNDVINGMFTVQRSFWP